MHPLFLLILGVSGVYSASHSLQFLSTFVSGKGWGLPEYSTVGYVDDQQIMNYNSDLRLARPVAQWMNQLGPEIWNVQTMRCKSHDVALKHTVITPMSRVNQTEGFHSYQWMSGCELRDDGSTADFYRYGYDGVDLMYLDTQKWVYVPNMPEADIITQRWNSPDERVWEGNKNYLQIECIELLMKYIKHGRDDLEKRVTPEVKVIGHQLDKVTKLSCWVYGFYPRAVDVKWIQNEQDEVPLDEAQQILPNPDGTYQIRVTVEVAAGEEERYSCHVDHSSLEKTRIVKWEPKSGHTIGVIIGAVFGCLVVLGIAGFLIYKKKTSDYKTTSTSEASSDSSNITVTA
ncbi:BOLA class I histocompatibility antigen, alpha chain BL3-6-like [Mixophyes fleayi]|uniref:BOLA class I histocompatibility antigen, alpha chain BL3-6-like n=1 Tax=Mixophyes fleayi TaxID=3061075 RepID=UPI003F4DD093